MLDRLRLFLNRLERSIFLFIVKIARIIKFFILLGTKLAVVAIVGYLIIFFAFGGGLLDIPGNGDPGGSSSPLSTDTNERPNQNAESDINLQTGTKTVEGTSYNAKEIEDSLRRKVNNYRKSQGVSKLKEIDKLRINARRYSKAMGVRNFYSHTDPDGRGAQLRIAGRFSFCRAAAENIHKIPLDKKIRHSATGRVMTISSQSQLAEVIFEDWKASSGHNRNMLDSRMRVSGMGVYIDKKSGNAYATHQLCIV